MTSERTPVLRLSSLFAGYGRFDVVRDVDIRVDEGEAVALLGPNGAGKTTVLRAIMGLVKHRRGTICVGDADVSSLPPYRIARGLAAIAPEGRRLFLDQSVDDNLILGALHLRRDKKRVQDLLASVYNLFPVLLEYRRRRSSFLSGGEQYKQQLALATRPLVQLRVHRHGLREHARRLADAGIALARVLRDRVRAVRRSPGPNSEPEA